MESGGPEGTVQKNQQVRRRRAQSGEWTARTKCGTVEVYPSNQHPEEFYELFSADGGEVSLRALHHHMCLQWCRGTCKARTCETEASCVNFATVI